ncbi:MAG: HigA family addiction module antitoxin [Arenicella sp.]|jgi:addiction module HigA family antidote|nr:HigA family addiction module antitoxin [Arenicella sp.]HAU68366.1 addiction module antidote protein, HigA family [Gammaproteobacteria bacterium]
MSKSAITIDPIHPGEILLEEFLKPLGISANRLAKHIEVPTNRVTSIINGHRRITGDTALRFSNAFDTTSEFWINLQSHYELESAKQNSNFNFGPLREYAA